MAEGKHMRKSKFGWLSVFFCGVGAVLLLALPVAAQYKGTWERPKNWESLVPNVDYVPNTFVVGFTKKATQKDADDVVQLIRQFGADKKLQINDVSSQYFRNLEGGIIL
jgi:hypothetical protein